MTWNMHIYKYRDYVHVFGTEKERKIFFALCKMQMDLSGMRADAQATKNSISLLSIFSCSFFILSSSTSNNMWQISTKWIWWKIHTQCDVFCLFAVCVCVYVGWYILRSAFYWFNERIFFKHTCLRMEHCTATTVLKLKLWIIKSLL